MNIEKRKKPIRTCLGCKQKSEKLNLIRIVRTQNSKVEIDKSGRANGRGGYICLTNQCIDKALKKKLIDKALKVNISEDDLKDLEEKLYEIKTGSK